MLVDTRAAVNSADFASADFALEPVSGWEQNTQHTTSRGRPLLIFTGLTLDFLKQFFIGLWLTLPVLMSLAAVITIVGQFVGKKEGWSRFHSLYWSFITASTVGYGDIHPVKRVSQILALLIALLGVVLTGIIIAVAVQAMTLALKTR